MKHSPLHRAGAPLRGRLVAVMATVWAAGLLLAGASHAQGPMPQPPDPDLAAALALVGPAWPADTRRRATTSGDIYLANLDSQIAALRVRVQRLADDRSLARLALLRYHRFQVLGTLPDAVAARTLLEAARARSHHVAVDLAAAQVLLGFHEFERSQQAVHAAARAGAAPDVIGARQAAIDAATGVTAETAAQTGPAAAEPATHVLAAADYADRGEPAAASRLLKQAQDDYADTSPYELSWLHVQQGIVFLRYGELEAARRFFAAAHERFPQYALATEHLAEAELALGRPETARRLYARVAEQTDHPEFWYRLSLAERQLGLAAAADTHATRARQGYETLLKDHPAMYADHAARYLLANGEAARAHELAQANYRQRRTVGAANLLIETAVEVGDRELACRLLDRIRTTGYAPPERASLPPARTGDCSGAAPAVASAGPL